MTCPEQLKCPVSRVVFELTVFRSVRVPGSGRGWLQKCWLRRASAMAIVAPEPRRCVPTFRYTSSHGAEALPISKAPTVKMLPGPDRGWAVGALSSATGIVLLWRGAVCPKADSRDLPSAGTAEGLRAAGEQSMAPRSSKNAL
jgi:hypothetical protein